MEPTKLEKLLISEVSGVDSPANQLDGWMVTKAAGSQSTIVAKIREALLGPPTGKDDLDMDRTELVEVLGENNEALAKAVAEAVAKSVAPAEGEGAEVKAPETKPESTDSKEVTEEAIGELAETISKSIQDTLTEKLQPYNDILEKVLDRIERVESAFGVAARKSLEGQETGEAGEPVEKSTPGLADAITSAFNNPRQRRVV